MAAEKKVAIIGAGPAGLMAAEVLLQGGVQVDIYDAMPSVGRKFLMAGKGGLNLTHAEGKADFITRFGQHSAQVGEWLDKFDAAALRAWAKELGIDVGREVKALRDAHAVSFTDGAISLHSEKGIPLRSLGIGSARLLLAGLHRRAAADRRRGTEQDARRQGTGSRGHAIDGAGRPLDAAMG